MDINIKVAQLVVSRICHDLAGSLSAVNAGVELIKDDGGLLDGEAMSLVDASAGQSVRKLSFFRVLFGSGGGSDGVVSLSALRDLCQNYIEGSKVSLDWSDEVSLVTTATTDGNIEITTGKVLLGLVLMGVESLPRGGSVSVGVHCPDGAIGFTVVASGDQASMGAEAEMAMDPNTAIDNLSARTIHAHFTAKLVDLLSGEMELSKNTLDTPGEVRLAAIIPQ